MTNTEQPPTWTISFRNHPREPLRTKQVQCWSERKAERLFWKAMGDSAHYGRFIVSIKQDEAN